MSKTKIVVTFLLTILLGITAFCSTAYASQVNVSLIPTRDAEFGEKVGNVIVSEDNKKVYQNYTRGYCVADLISNTQVSNKRDVGGKNVNASGEAEFLPISVMTSWIKQRQEDLDVTKYWSRLANKYELEIQYDLSTVLGKIADKYAELVEEGYNCGIPTDNLSVWDESVIKLDFYDGDSEYGFGGNRIRVTTLAYSFLKDDVYMIGGEFFNYYQNAKAGSLCEPITDPFDYTLEGKTGKVQAFAQGLIFLDSNNKISVKAGVRYNEETKEFEPLVLDFADITATEIIQIAIDSNPYYGGTNENKFTVESIKEKFYEKYLDLIDKKFNPGLPDSEGIFYWDSELIKQAYVGSDGVGDAWGRTNMLLILNPIDGEVYKVSGAILNIVDESAQGLGNANRLGYPMSDEKTVVIGDLSYTYQDFSKGTIYSISNQEQLTRFIKGKTFAEVTEDRKDFKPNNPLFNYVVEPWIIVTVSIVSVVVLASIGFVVVKTVSKKKRMEEEVQ